MTRKEDKNRPIKVLLVISSGSLGGGQTHLLLLVKALIHDEHFSPQVVCHPGGELERTLSKLEIPLHLFDLEDLRHIFDLYGLAKLIRQLKPDLIHAHLNRAALWASFFASIGGYKIITTAHGMTKPLYYRLSEQVIAVSRAVKEHMIRLAPSMKEKIRVVYNGIPQTYESNRHRQKQLEDQLGIGDSDRIVTVIGKLHSNKGQHIAIRALSAIPKRLNVKLLLVGDGPEEYRLKRLVDILSLSPRVIFLPPQPRLFEIYELSHFVLVPSLREALSLVVLEALRQAKPVIASNTGGIPEIIKTGYNGVLVNANEPKALTEAIVDGFNDYRRHEKMAKRGQRTVIDDFNFKRCYKQTKKVYLEVMNMPIP